MPPPFSLDPAHRQGGGQISGSLGELWGRGAARGPSEAGESVYICDSESTGPLGCGSLSGVAHREEADCGGSGAWVWLKLGPPPRSVTRSDLPHRSRPVSSGEGVPTPQSPK